MEARLQNQSVNPSRGGKAQIITGNKRQKTCWGSCRVVAQIGEVPLKNFILCNCNLGINSFLWILEGQDGLTRRQGTEAVLSRVSPRIVRSQFELTHF